ncbi:MAG: hypothetical protein KAI41_11225, partial [Hyphomicrobiaceae bacterium]|nr:hypothetical protein [Hyphomicrobiaceae bacterium]
ILGSTDALSEPDGVPLGSAGAFSASAATVTPVTGSGVMESSFSGPDAAFAASSGSIALGFAVSCFERLKNMGFGARLKES